MIQSLWLKLKAWCLNSLTVAWGYVQILSSAIFLGLSFVSDLASDPGVKLAIDGLHPPAWAMLALAMMGYITIAARLRTVQKKTDENNQIVA